MIPIPPYDNKEYKFRHSDADRREGRARVAGLLGLADVPDSSGLLYDLSLFSGGIGVYDELALTLPANNEIWGAVLAANRVSTPEEICGDPSLVEDFLWLVCRDNPSPEHRLAAVNFLNAEKRDFQSECRPSDRIVFSPWSNVNDWVALWGTDELLNYLAFSQG